MLTYNTIYSYSTIFYTLLPYTRIVYYSLAILLYTGILGSIWKEKISILDFFYKEKILKKKKTKCKIIVCKLTLKSNKKILFHLKNFLFFLTDACKHNERVSSTLFFLFNEGKLEIRRSVRFSRSEVITYTTSMRKRLRNEKKGILVDISNMEV